jgi:hypothetical protein
MTREIAPTHNPRLNLRCRNVALPGNHRLGPMQKARVSRIIGKRPPRTTPPISVLTTPFLLVDPSGNHPASLSENPPPPHSRQTIPSG